MRRAMLAPLLLTLVIGTFAAGAQSVTPTPLPATPPPLDPDCIRFNDPPAVGAGAIAFVDFTTYSDALDQAVAAWSPERGFAIPLRELAPVDDAVPSGANLIVRDAVIPNSAFKGVTVTWSEAPSTITLNLAAMPPASATDPHDVHAIRSVLAHELGHALGLGDVPSPGATIRECAGMLMKRSVDKGGGAFDIPQPGDIALYCLRWDGDICGDVVPERTTPVDLAGSSPSRPALFDGGDAPEAASSTYRFHVLTCASPPARAVAADQIVTGNLPSGCHRAPAGVLFEVSRGDGLNYGMLTNGGGEFVVELPAGVAADVTMHEGDEGYFPSLIGFQPLETEAHIGGDNQGCLIDGKPNCGLVSVLVP